MTDRPIPIMPINRACMAGSLPYRSRMKVSELGWQRNGRSWSYAYCGSMSVEELRECLDATAQLNFDLNDRGYKVYIDRYPHAGDCPKPPTTCACAAKLGGGPIEFYLQHLYDGGMADDERNSLYARILERCRRPYRSFSRS